ncbi:uncharacterized protein PHALS_08493 [Plasmopara halstedii]|uniref:Uncharacterized protein n=1 Tax=Plasmopara halstedii TaxID=4781 RepID=A0A0P1ABW8_PLAHL|nr:uncharacterized protein PHALS_08493 [Plasmopara halstedii]CEG38415.1 hypothetical protein PHALS_08493 [Plasmopara halstedii]|eukprot:XP_024574784.1 hypothetical protein PHALS_08493 [Plasmopara halstedii]
MTRRTLSGGRRAIDSNALPPQMKENICSVKFGYYCVSLSMGESTQVSNTSRTLKISLKIWKGILLWPSILKQDAISFYLCTGWNVSSLASTESRRQYMTCPSLKIVLR